MLHPLFCAFCVCSLFCCAVLNVVSSFAITSLGKGELFVLLLLHFDTMCLLVFGAMGWIVALPGHSHLLLDLNHRDC